MVRLFPWVLLLGIFALQGDPLSDLLARGVPARSAFVEDETFRVEMLGSLARGDSLLKHYGGTFFLLLDSIAQGWPLLGLEVRITGSTLILFREDVFEALSLLSRGAGEEELASWVLQHTWVVHQD